MIPLKLPGKLLFCSVLCLLEGLAAQCQGVMPFINGILFNKMKTENQFNYISVWHNYYPWANPSAVRKTQLKATLGTFLFMCFQWPGCFKGCTKCVLQDQPASGISTQTSRWHVVKSSWSRKPSKSFMGKCPMCLKCQRGTLFLLRKELHCRIHKWMIIVLLTGMW